MQRATMVEQGLAQPAPVQAKIAFAEKAGAVIMTTLHDVQGITGQMMAGQARHND